MSPFYYLYDGNSMSFLRWVNVSIKWTHIYKVSDTILGKSQCPGTVRAQFPQCMPVLFPFLYLDCKPHTVHCTRMRRWQGVHELCSRICGGDCYTSQDWACIVNLAMCCVLLTLKVPWRPCVAWIADIGMIRIVQLSTKQLAHFTWFCIDSEHHTHSIWFVLGKGANVWKQNPPAKSAHFKAPVRVVHKWPVLA